MSDPLHQQILSLDHAAFVKTLSAIENLLIIQDLDGVCMGLVNDPLTRSISPSYIQATQAFGPHFYVLTNGEHTGRRGINRIVETSLRQEPAALGEQQQYLPGLAAGGVQWQTRDGLVSHPGVSEAELSFLKAVPAKMEACLRAFFAQQPIPTELQQNLDTYLAATILDNIASPTVNLNTLYPLLAEDPSTFVALQKTMRSRLEDLLAEAQQQGLGNSFFIHYAPNLGRDSSGNEVVWFCSAGESGRGQSGTTDYQFMLRGAIKEAGVLALLNRYYFQQTGRHPLGEHFSVRQAPQDMGELVSLVVENFDPAQMPLIVGVGDTVTAQQSTGQIGGEVSIEVKRGGSDRNFLQLIQNLRKPFNSHNLTVYVDSSSGELKNRQPLKLAGPTQVSSERAKGQQKVVSGPGDPADPLQLNVAFPGGHIQYCRCFEQAAQKRL